MTLISQTERICQLIEEKLKTRGASVETAIEETILINDGNYCGRRYKLDGFQAVWFAEENQIKFYSEDGTLLDVLALQSDSGDDQLEAA